MRDLTQKTVKELRDVAKELNIKGRWDMTKQELIEAIGKAADWSDDEITFETDCIIKSNELIESEGSQKVTKTTLEYLESAEPGTLVAFKRNSKDIAMSGKLVSVENGKCTIESKKGTQFKVNPENVIWVKTGDRWPSWVFALFNKNSKGGEVSEVIGEEN